MLPLTLAQNLTLTLLQQDHFGTRPLVTCPPPNNLCEGCHRIDLGGETVSCVPLKAMHRLCQAAARLSATCMLGVRTPSSSDMQAVSNLCWSQVMSGVTGASPTVGRSPWHPAPAAHVQCSLG
mmetsp:Transcript_37876/g.67696  ORF Transcript_37876/g.67696 Transcript_37876/m.67696 type:complete len:123 (-) Transcript_37876:469-837(-)